MKLNFVLLCCLMVLPFIQTAHIQLLDITPEEAQKLITQQSLDLRYSNKLSEASAVGKSYNGKLIDSDDYTEEVYEANQFHGQDGLGRFVFGHTDNQQARLEAGNANGEVRGQYRYIDPWGKDIEVQYWSDSLGFHQSDNRPKYDIQPVTETPEVRAAREEHERLWKEAARLNGIYDTNGFYNSENDDLEGQLSNRLEKFTRHPALPYNKHITSDNAADFGEVRDDAVIVESTQNKGKRGRARFIRQYENVEEVTSEPRGFFYSFDYPVAHINDHGASGQHESQPSENFYVFSRAADDESKKENDEVQTVAEARVSGKIAAGLVPEDEVHDVQIHPKQKKEIQPVEEQRISAKIAEGIDPEDEVHDAQIHPKQRLQNAQIQLVEDQKISAKIADGLTPEDEVHDTQVHPKQKVQIQPVEEVRISAKIAEGIDPEDEVHDTQVHPKQKTALESDRISTKIHDGLAPEDEVHDVQINPKQIKNRSINRGRGSIRYKDTV